MLLAIILFRILKFNHEIQGQGYAKITIFSFSLYTFITVLPNKINFCLVHEILIIASFSASQCKELSTGLNSAETDAAGWVFLFCFDFLDSPFLMKNKNREGSHLSDIWTSVTVICSFMTRL